MLPVKVPGSQVLQVVNIAAVGCSCFQEPGIDLLVSQGYEPDLFTALVGKPLNLIPVLFGPGSPEVAVQVIQAEPATQYCCKAQGMFEKLADIQDMVVDLVVLQRFCHLLALG